MTQININFEPINPKQKLFMESIKTFILLSGAVSAGKSFLGCWKGFMLNLIYPGNRGLICRKEFSSLKSSTLVTLFEKVIPPEMIIKYDKIDGVLTHRTGVPGVNSVMCFSGLDKKADQQYPTKIGSTEYGWIFGDETTEFTEDDFQVLATRLRYKITVLNFYRLKKAFGWHKNFTYDIYMEQMVRQFFGATNPDSPKHYLYKFFFEDQNDDRLLIRTTPQENIKNDPKYLKLIDSTLTGIRRERLWHGKWVQAAGAIYDCFSYGLNVIDINFVEEMSTYKRFFGGADSNFPKPRAGVIFGEKANGEIHILDEFYQEATQPEDLGKWYSQFATHFGIHITVYHDPSDPSAIDKLNAYPGVSCEKAKNPVSPGIASVHRHLKLGVLKINKICVKSIEYLGSYKWKKGSKDVPDKADDHLPDAIRYGIFTNNIGESGESAAVPEFM